jgi:DNA polymerase-3 subunit epsilon
MERQGEKLMFPTSPDFVAIDFETATRSPASACAIGLAFVEAGRIVANPSWLIRPPRLEFDADFVAIHGINAERVRGHPEFGDLWPELGGLLQDRLIFAHNAVFDVNVLLGMLKAYSIAIPTLRYACTKVVAQKTWPDWHKYDLATLAGRHGLYFRHHDAGEDARVCAHIALQAMQAKAAASVDHLLQLLYVNCGRLSPAGHTAMSQNPALPLLGAFGRWAPRLHQLPEQRQRRQRSLGLTATTLDYRQPAAVINGYTVTLDSCTCPDFVQRELPCKHIYHLAWKVAMAARASDSGLYN